LLRPFSDPPFQTYGEFVTFYSHICEVSHAKPSSQMMQLPNRLP
jgi:hypothetical protein